MALPISCPRCAGEGFLEWERWKYRSHDDDTGGFQAYWKPCEDCDGTGEIEPPEQY